MRAQLLQTQAEAAVPCHWQLRIANSGRTGMTACLVCFQGRPLLFMCLQLHLRRHLLQQQRRRKYSKLPFRFRLLQHLQRARLQCRHRNLPRRHRLVRHRSRTILAAVQMRLTARLPLQQVRLLVVPLLAAHCLHRHPHPAAQAPAWGKHSQACCCRLLQHPPVQQQAAAWLRVGHSSLARSSARDTARLSPS